MTVDLRRRFIMGVDPGGYAGDAAKGIGGEATGGSKGGFRWHGLSEEDPLGDSGSFANRHPDHDDHFHVVNHHYQQAQAGSDVYVEQDVNQEWKPGQWAYMSGMKTGNYHSPQAIVSRHGGIVNDWTPLDPPEEAHDYKDTDNRPPYYVLAFIERLR